MSLLVCFIFVGAVVSQQQAPDTAECERETKCNGDYCWDVCVQGTVVVDEWALQSIQFQRSLQRNVSFYYYEMHGTHNGYQSQNRGWGVEEQGMHELFVLAGYEDNNVVLENQRYSPTDQLNMGLRWIEMDIWWTFGFDDIRLCHDPFGDPRLIYWVERAANETNTSVPVWDPANLGCYAEHNSPLIEGLHEIDDWLRRPGNEEEIVVIYYDTKTLFTQEKVEWAVTPAIEVFGDMMFTPSDKQLLFPSRWPSPIEMLQLGKRVIVENQASQFLQNDYAQQHIFTPALWSGSNGGAQFGFGSLQPFPACTVNGKSHYGNSIARCLDGSINKGPVGNGPRAADVVAADVDSDIAIDNIEFINELYAKLDEDEVNVNSNLGPEELQALAACGITTSAIDNVQPSFMQHFVWSWARDEPSGGGNGCVLLDALRDGGKWIETMQCNQLYFHACVNANDRNDWRLTPSRSTATTAACPQGYYYSYPITGFENSKLKQIAGGESVWLSYDFN